MMKNLKNEPAAIHLTPTMAQLILEQIGAHGVTLDHAKIPLTRHVVHCKYSQSLSHGHRSAGEESFEEVSPLLTVLQGLTMPFSNTASLFQGLRQAGIITPDAEASQQAAAAAKEKLAPRLAQAQQEGKPNDVSYDLNSQYAEAQVFTLDLEKLRGLAKPGAAVESTQRRTGAAR